MLLLILLILDSHTLTDFTAQFVFPILIHKRLRKHFKIFNTFQYQKSHIQISKETYLTRKPNIVLCTYRALKLVSFEKSDILAVDVLSLSRYLFFLLSLSLLLPHPQYSGKLANQNPSRDHNELCMNNYFFKSMIYDIFMKASFLVFSSFFLNK